MGKKKRKHPDIEEVLCRPWCFYCERDFEDLKLLISHQKAKHFKCEECGRRLNTAGGLAVHLNQVHKETLTQVENALPNRQGLDIEIFGMEGIPQEVLEQHRNRIIQDFYQEQEDRRAATGNVLPGQGKSPRKKLKVETAEELKARLADWRAKKAAGIPVGGEADGGAAQTPAYQQQPPAQAPYSEAQYPPPGAAPAYPQQPYGAYPPTNLPARPDGTPAAPPGLPQRPSFSGGYWNGPGAPPPGYPAGSASTLDELLSGAAAQGQVPPPQPQQGDDIDQLIRMAEAGVRPQEPAAAAAAPPAAEKKGKKDKVRMFYDAEVSPEEKMAQLPRYALVQ